MISLGLRRSVKGARGGVFKRVIYGLGRRVICPRREGKSVSSCSYHHDPHHHHRHWRRSPWVVATCSPFSPSSISSIRSSQHLLVHRGFSKHPSDTRKQAKETKEESSGNVLLEFKEPEQWFPAARSRRRRIILHVGPTNSGKTYSALKRLREANRGLYCSPLRLLAWEVADRLIEEHNLPCRLVTGQERTDPPGARHVACTVEMADIWSAFDVAVLDEFQMIGDRDRGWAWTRAILGVNASEVHLCGDDAAVPLLQRMCQRTGVSD